MKIRPDPNTVHPISGYENEIYVKPTLKNPNICVGEFTYIADSDFESHVTHLYDWNGDRLIIGKFCQIAAGVEFVMNGANHQMNAVTTFPFYTLEGWDMSPPEKHDLPLKGDTVIGSDVWVGQNAGRRSKARVKLESENDPALKRIELILTMFPGTQQMIIYCQKEKKRIGAQCVIHEALVDELKEMLGSENVVIK